MWETDLDKFCSSVVHKMIRPWMSITWTITQVYYLLKSNPFSIVCNAQNIPFIKKNIVKVYLVDTGVIHI